jgi:hypothetical protein
VYADFDAENLLTIVKQHHHELVQQADRERLLRRQTPPVRRVRTWQLWTLIDGVVRCGVWRRSRGRRLASVRKVPINAGYFGASKTNRTKVCRHAAL